MSDRLTLANAIEDAGIDRHKAERIASVIFDAIHDTVATKADLQSEVASLRSDMNSGFARTDVAIERVRSTVRETEPRLLLRMGGIATGAAALLFGALRLWPPH